MYGPDACTMHQTDHVMQPTDEERRLILEDVDATRQTDDPIRLGGWVFLGAVAQFYADQVRVPPLLRVREDGRLPRVAVVETLFFIKVRSTSSVAT